MHLIAMLALTLSISTYFCCQHYVGDLQPVQMEASVQHPTPVCAELDGLVPGVQQVQAEEIA